MTQSAEANNNLQSHDKEMRGMSGASNGNGGASSKGGARGKQGARKTARGPSAVQAAWLARGLG